MDGRTKNPTKDPKSLIHDRMYQNIPHNSHKYNKHVENNAELAKKPIMLQVFAPLIFFFLVGSYLNSKKIPLCFKSFFSY